MIWFNINNMRLVMLSRGMARFARADPGRGALPKTYRYYEWGWPVVLFLLALWLRLDLSRSFTFDGLYGQDAFAYYEYGQQVRDAIVAARLPGPMYWPLGFPALLATGFALLGEHTSVAQGLVLATGALIPPLVYALAVDALPRAGWSRRDARLAGITAAVLLAFGGQFLQSSVVIMADVPALFWAALSAWALGRYAHTLDRRPPIRGAWLGLAAFALGWAACTRWHYGALAVPWSMYCASLWRRRRRYWPDALFAITVGGLTLLPQIVHSWSNPAPVADHAWLRSWSPANAMKTTFVTPDGAFHYDHRVAVFYARAAYDGWYIHPVFLAPMALGTILLLRRMRASRSGFALGGLLFVWTLAGYGFLAGIPYQNVRFSLAFFLPLTLLAGIGFAALWRAIARLSRLKSFRPLSLAARGLVIVAVASAVQTCRDQAMDTVGRLVAQKEMDLGAVRWTEAQIEPGATVYTLDLWPMMRYYAPAARTVQLYYETPGSLAARLPGDAPAYLLLNLWAIDHQWVGKRPWQDYYALVENPGLDYLGRFGNYHLFRVREVSPPAG
jgi:hypothetical protein